MLKLSVIVIVPVLFPVTLVKPTTLPNDKEPLTTVNVTVACPFSISTSDIVINLLLLLEKVKLAFSFKVCATGTVLTGAVSTGIMFILILDWIIELLAPIPSLNWYVKLTLDGGSLDELLYNIDSIILLTKALVTTEPLLLVKVICNCPLVLVKLAITWLL